MMGAKMSEVLYLKDKKPIQVVRQKRRGSFGLDGRPKDEATIQRAVLHYLQAVLPDVLVYHCPNEGERTQSYAAFLKSLGMLAGVADLTYLLAFLRRYS